MANHRELPAAQPAPPRMGGLAHQAAILSLSRIANYGLMIVSPVILVRFLTVNDFGRYREFLLYASLVQTAAGFSISESVLYFVPSYPASVWRVLGATTYLTAFASVLVVGVLAVLQLLVPSGVVGPYLIPVVLYVLLFVNLDWWESYWLAANRPVSVLLYSGGRLLARMLVVVAVAVLTQNVSTIIWSLIALEALRFAGAFLAWRSADRSGQEPRIEHIRREQLRFCVPYGIASILYLFSRNLGNVAIVKVLGAAALAHFTIGTYGEPIILAFRNSISTVLMPRLVRLGEPAEALRLWQRATLMNCLLLFPGAAIVAWYAEPLVLKAFGAAYRPAIPILQWYALVIVRACFDFSPPLRAINQTRPFVTTAIIAAMVNGLALAALLPVMGIVGAAIALSIANAVEAVCLGLSVSSRYRCGLRGLLPWIEVAKVAACALGAAFLAFGVTFPWRTTVPGVIAGVILYAGAFIPLLLAVHVEEAKMAFVRVKRRALQPFRS